MKTSNIILYVGIGIIMISLIYLIMNFQNADDFITKWILSIFIGVSFTFWGTVSGIIKRKQCKDN